MKLKYRFVLAVLAAAFLCGAAQRASAQAGDTLVVNWQDANGDVMVNALRDAILNDTNRPAGRVYKLLRGGYYQNADRIENPDFHLRIVGELGGPTEFDNPPVLQMVSRLDNTVDGRLITGGNSLTLKNLYIPGAIENGTQTYYEPITTNASNARFEVENVIFERSNFSMMSFYGTNNDIHFKDCKFRNLIGEPSTQQWEGRGISVWADQDTVVVENCTFFNLGMTAFQVEGGAAKYVLFVHNTLVNVGRAMTSGNWWREAYFANNLFINVFWHGEGTADLTDPGRNPRANSSGMFSIGALPSVYGPEQGRRILLANTASYRDSRFATFYGSTALAQPFINNITAEDYFNTYENMVAVDTTWLATKPNLATYPTDDIINDMWQNISDLRAGVTPAHPYFWQLPEFNGERCHVCVNWPLPENFSYTDANLLTAGTDNLPLGDLNWFPTQKAQWEANKTQYVAHIKDLAGPEIILNVAASVEAELLALGGDAAVKTFEGFSYFQMDGGGFIQWKFNLANAGLAEFLVYTNLRGNSDRGQRIFVNGTNIRNNSTYGEYFWSSSLGDPTNQWFESHITQGGLIEGAAAMDLPAGDNTIRIEPSWGYQHFSYIKVLQGGVVVANLTAPDADYSIVTPRGEGSPWVPSRFKSVAMNNSGSVAWTVSAPASGNYRLQVFYQNYSGENTGQAMVDGTPAVSINFASNSDSTGLSVLSDRFSLPAGSHVITLSSTNMSVDQLQLIQEISVSVAERNDVPFGYVLAQNYPNPFNPTTSIKFALAVPEQVKLTIYNMLGQKVTTLVDSRMPAGTHVISFDAHHLTSGVYFYRLEAGEFKSQKRMLLIK